MMPTEPISDTSHSGSDKRVLNRVLRRTLSSQLARLAAGFADRPVRLGELTDVLQLRGYNALLIFLAFPFVTPVPLPGFSTVFGLVIALLGVRMVLGQKPWLPERLTARELHARFLPKLLLVTSRMFGRLEKLLKPRLFYPEYPAAFQRASGVIIVICGSLLLLPLPVPFSNAFPAFTIILLAAAGLERDALSSRLRENLERAFSVDSSEVGARPQSFSLAPAEGERAGVRGTSAKPGPPLIASHATPHRFAFPSYFPQPALPLDNPLTEQGIALGRQLFHDPRLSVNNRQSCASCHQASAAFTDAGQRISLGAEGRRGARNAMPLFNLAWKHSFFWDGRAPSLREQVLLPIQDPTEMHERLTNVIQKLDAFASNRFHFAAAFGTPGITSDRIARALEQFLLAQVSRDSKFDRSLNGEAKLTAEEQRGFELFHTEYDPRRGQFGADCFHCHGGPLFQSQSLANNGLDAIPSDQGRYEVTRKEGDRGKFAVPSLRNVARTAPYMHDGRFDTLEQVIEHYSTGVRRSATLDPNLAKHPGGGVPLSAGDKRALVAFLQTLTDQRFVETPGKLKQSP